MIACSGGDQIGRSDLRAGTVGNFHVSFVHADHVEPCDDVIAA